MGKEGFVRKGGICVRKERFEWERRDLREKGGI